MTGYEAAQETEFEHYGLVRLHRGRLHHAAVDRIAFTRWSTDLAAVEPRLRAAVEMEVQARLLRLLHQAAPGASLLAHHIGEATAEAVAHAIRYVTRHFARPADPNHDPGTYPGVICEARSVLPRDYWPSYETCAEFDLGGLASAPDDH